MDIKELNKSQLIMLALLLSFITSVATGIVTVTLMQQAPSSVMIPINRVVRETVEKIVPQEGNTVTNTIIIKEEDLIVDAIEKNASALFSITKEAQDIDGKIIEVSSGRGFAISNDGIIVADNSLVSEGGVYYVKNKSGKFKTDFISSNINGFSFFKIGLPLDLKNKLEFTVPSFGDLSKMKTGQKILVLGNTISSFMFEGNKDIKINVVKSNGGALIVDLNGGALGIALSGDASSFSSIDTILEALKVKDTTPDPETKTP